MSTFIFKIIDGSSFFIKVLVEKENNDRNMKTKYSIKIIHGL